MGEPKIRPPKFVLATHEFSTEMTLPLDIGLICIKRVLQDENLDAQLRGFRLQVRVETSWIED